MINMHIKIFCAFKSNGNIEMGILHIYIKLENTRRVKIKLSLVGNTTLSTL